VAAAETGADPDSSASTGSDTPSTTSLETSAGEETAGSRNGSTPPGGTPATSGEAEPAGAHQSSDTATFSQTGASSTVSAQGSIRSGTPQPHVDEQKPEILDPGHDGTDTLDPAEGDIEVVDTESVEHVRESAKSDSGARSSTAAGRAANRLASVTPATVETESHSAATAFDAISMEAPATIAARLSAPADTWATSIIASSATVADSTAGEPPYPAQLSAPVTLRSMVSDVLRWIGLGPVSTSAPIPAAPMPRVIELL
jgi:hypothetical protein